MERCAAETDGNCSLPALKLGATMRALGQNITDRDAMRLALNSSIIDSQVCVCAHACVRACVYVCMHASDAERVAMDPSGWAAGLTYAKVSKERPG